MYNPMGMSDVMVGQQNYLMGYEKSSGRTFMGPDNNLSKTYYQAWQNPQIIGREVDLASQYHTQENAMASYARAQADYIKQIADAQAYAQKVMSQASSYSRGGSSAYAQGGSAGASAYATSYNPYAQQSAGYANPYSILSGYGGASSSGASTPFSAGYANPYSLLSGYGGASSSGYSAPFSGGYTQGFSPYSQTVNPYLQTQQQQSNYSGGLGQYGFTQIIGLLQQILQKISVPPQTQYIPIPISLPGINNGNNINGLGVATNNPQAINYNQILSGLQPQQTNVTPQNTGSGIDGINGLLPLLLTSLIGGNNGISLPGLNDIIRPVITGTNPNAGSGWGDPHFNMAWVKEGHMDFHGKNLTGEGGTAAYRMYDNGSSAINSLFQGKEGSATIMNEVSGKIGKDVTFKFDADDSKLLVNGKELKAGESIRATGTGIFLPNGQEAAGSISMDESGLITVNTGDAIFTWKKAGNWAGYNYLNLDYKVTAAGTSAAKTADGKAKALGGIFGSSISTGNSMFKDISKKTQAEINTILDKALRLDTLEDFGGQKLLEGQAATQDYKYGENAEKAANATST